MSIDAYVIRDELEPQQFFPSFLASNEFTLDQLKQICRRLGEPLSGTKKLDLANRIAAAIGRRDPQPIAEYAFLCLTERPKDWTAIKTGSISGRPSLKSPWTLMVERGEECWYGPVARPDDVPDVGWYVRPVFVKHWTLDEAHNRPVEVDIRWLCWARVANNLISLHWRGFTRTPMQESVRVNSRKESRQQFEYWEHIERLFAEIEDLTNARASYTNLHDLTLNQLWDKYKENDAYRWINRRIRAESNGVSLNAYAGAVEQLNPKGITHLAETIRHSIQLELRRLDGHGLPNPTILDHVIERTLIKEYGTLSYEFSLERDATLLFHGHCYFGLRPIGHRQDSFPHICFGFLRRTNDLQQLQFLMAQNSQQENRESHTTKTIPMFAE